MERKQDFINKMDELLDEYAELLNLISSHLNGNKKAIAQICEERHIDKTVERLQQDRAEMEGSSLEELFDNYYYSYFEKEYADFEHLKVSVEEMLAQHVAEDLYSSQK